MYLEKMENIVLNKNFGKPKRPRIVDPQFSSYKARVKKKSYYHQKTS